MVRTKPIKKPRRSNKPPDDDDDEEFEPPNFTPPQSGLVPIPGTPFYATPDEPASPFDCDRYPESLYCGENPFTQVPVGLEPSIVLDECNLGIQLTPTLGFVILPSLQIVYRRNTSECRVKKPKDPVLPSSTEFFPTDIPTKVGCLYAVEVGVDHWQSDYISNNNEPNSTYYATYPDGFLTKFVVIVWGPVAGISVQNRSFLNFDQEVVVTSVAGVAAKLCTGNVYNTIADVERDFPRVLKILQLSSIDDWQYCSRFPLFTDKAKYAPTNPVWQIKAITEVWCNPSPILTFSPPPPKLPERCDCNMTCCPSTSQNDQLLRSLIQKVDKLSKIIGVDDYPVSLPTSLISKDEGFLGNLVPNFNQDVPSLTRFLAWYVERFDEIMGQWEIPIEVKDSDPTRPGDQPVGFKLPNMAEAIAEMFGLMLQTSINSETLVNMNTRALVEGGQVKQQTFKTYMMAQAIADHMGFEYKETKHKIPMLFKIGEEELDKLLVEGELEVTAPEYTDSNDLKTSLNDLLQAAAIIRAVHFRKFNPNQDVKQQVKDLIANLVGSGDKINNQDTDSSGKDDFDRFLEDVETGFTQTPGATDPTNPYGRNYNERPKIKEIGSDTSDSNNGS